MVCYCISTSMVIECICWDTPSENTGRTTGQLMDNYQKYNLPLQPLIDVDTYEWLYNYKHGCSVHWFGSPICDQVPHPPPPHTASPRETTTWICEVRGQLFHSPAIISFVVRANVCLPTVGFFDKQWVHTWWLWMVTVILNHKFYTFSKPNSVKVFITKPWLE